MVQQSTKNYIWRVSSTSFSTTLFHRCNPFDYKWF